MVKSSGAALMLLGVAHLIAIGIDALPFAPGWLSLDLWTTGDWLPFMAQPTDVLASNAAFWATLGSCAVPSVILGALIMRMVNDGVPVPQFVGWGLFLWLGVCSLIIEPSGFPLGWIISLALVLGIHRQRSHVDPLAKRLRTPRRHTAQQNQ
mgnify:CR=1 FL=1|jgi:hypothetical protein